MAKKKPTRRKAVRAPRYQRQGAQQCQKASSRYHMSDVVLAAITVFVALSVVWAIGMAYQLGYQAAL